MFTVFEIGLSASMAGSTFILGGNLHILYPMRSKVELHR